MDDDRLSDVDLLAQLAEMEADEDAEMAGDLRNTPDATLPPRYDARLNDDDLWFVWDRIGTRQVGHATADQDEAEGFARGLNELMAYNADQAPVPATGGPGEVERLRAENLRLREHALKLLRERDGAIRVRDGLIKERVTETQAPATPDTGQRVITLPVDAVEQIVNLACEFETNELSTYTLRVNAARLIDSWSAAQAPAASTVSDHDGVRVTAGEPDAEHLDLAQRLHEALVRTESAPAASEDTPPYPSTDTARVAMSHNPEITDTASEYGADWLAELSPLDRLQVHVTYIARHWAGEAKGTTIGSEVARTLPAGLLAIPASEDTIEQIADVIAREYGNYTDGMEDVRAVDDGEGQGILNAARRISELPGLLASHPVTDEAVERVARALFVHDAKHGEHDPMWFVALIKADYLSRARVAIAALAEEVQHEHP